MPCCAYLRKGLQSGHLAAGAVRACPHGPKRTKLLHGVLPESTHVVVRPAHFKASARAQDIWDWAMSFWCDEGAAWILPQKPDMRLGIDPGAAVFTGFPYTAVTPGGRRSERSAVYERALRAVTTGEMAKVRSFVTSSAG